MLLVEGRDLIFSTPHQKGEKMADHPICHVEIPAIDPASASTFYADLFEWQIEVDPTRNSHMFQPQRGPGGALVEVGATMGARIGAVLMDVSTDEVAATLAHAAALSAQTL